MKEPKKAHQLLEDIENLKLDETLENLDKGSPHLNWGYLFIGLVTIFFVVWLLVEWASPNKTDLYVQTQTEQIQQLEQKVQRLEHRMQVLEDKQKAS